MGSTHEGNIATLRGGLKRTPEVVGCFVPLIQEALPSPSLKPAVARPPPQKTPELSS
jgi:hypothetical protein